MDYILSEMLGLVIFLVPLLLVMGVAACLGLLTWATFTGVKSGSQKSLVTG